MNHNTLSATKNFQSCRGKRFEQHLINKYDFGDGWNHNIVLEKILPIDDKINYPVCLRGEMCCPPDDCGGTWGYTEILEILEQPDHEEYEKYVTWLGEKFVPEYFDKDEVNELLKEKNYDLR